MVGVLLRGLLRTRSLRRPLALRAGLGVARIPRTVVAFALAVAVAVAVAIPSALATRAALWPIAPFTAVGALGTLGTVRAPGGAIVAAMAPAMTLLAARRAGRLRRFAGDAARQQPLEPRPEARCRKLRMHRGRRRGRRRRDR